MNAALPCLPRTFERSENVTGVRERSSVFIPRSRSIYFYGGRANPMVGFTGHQMLQVTYPQASCVYSTFRICAPLPKNSFGIFGPPPFFSDNEFAMRYMCSSDLLGSLKCMGRYPRFSAGQAPRSPHNSLVLICGAGKRDRLPPLVAGCRQRRHKSNNF